MASAEGSEQTTKPPLSARIAIKLVWLAVGPAGGLVAVSWVLAARMEQLFDAAVAEGWAQPFTGEAGDQALLPAMVGATFMIITILTAVLAFVLRECVRDGRRGTGAIAVAGAGLVVMVHVLLLTRWVRPLSDQQYTDDLYGWWYLPTYVAMAVAHAGGIVGAAIALTTRSARRWSRQRWVW